MMFAGFGPSRFYNGCDAPIPRRVEIQVRRGWRSLHSGLNWGASASHASGVHGTTPHEEKVWYRVVRHAKLPGVRLHDLRQT